MSNNAAKYLAMYPELKKQVVYTTSCLGEWVGNHPGGYTGNGVAIALSKSEINPSQIEKVGCQFGCQKMYLTFDQFIVHFGTIQVTDGSLDDNLVLCRHVQTIHLKDGKIYSFVEGDLEHTTNRYVLTFNPHDFVAYDKEPIDRLVKEGIEQIAEYNDDKVCYDYDVLE